MNCRLLYPNLNISYISKCNISSATAAVTKIHRSTYSRTYPALLVFPNGATIQIRYPIPQMIVKLPLDLNSLSPEEKRLHLLKKKPKEKVVKTEEKKTSFDPSKYINLIRKK